jgi:hypothetical protein
MKVIEPPVSSGESPSSCITARNCAMMSKSPEPLDVLLVMMFPFNVVGSIRLCFFDAAVL